MTTSSPPSARLVLIAGTNEVATREQQNRILSTPSECKLIVGTLPHHHDLPINNTINNEVVLVNACIKELAVRLNIQVLDFIKISQRYFTRHGLPLTMKYKWFLPKLIAETLSKVDHEPREEADRASCRHSSPSTQLPGIFPIDLNFSKVATVFISARALQTSILRIASPLLATNNRTQGLKEGISYLYYHLTSFF
ncbi:hypothetical protein J6590_068168 [Homalodisca vitripennis]|nr:hypothetical protein J6590_068168 [Homalodisca vitripennis]